MADSVLRDKDDDSAALELLHELRRRIEQDQFRSEVIKSCRSIFRWETDLLLVFVNDYFYKPSNLHRCEFIREFFNPKCFSSKILMDIYIKLLAFLPDSLMDCDFERSDFSTILSSMDGLDRKRIMNSIYCSATDMNWHTVPIFFMRDVFADFFGNSSVGKALFNVNKRS